MLIEVLVVMFGDRWVALLMYAMLPWQNCIFFVFWLLKLHCSP